MKHTPGPWRYVRENGSPTTGQHMIAGAVPGYLAQLRDCGSGDVTANARLIAAAPDLLETLRKMTDMVEAEVLGPEWLWAHEIIAEARAAIAKARG